MKNKMIPSTIGLLALTAFLAISPLASAQMPRSYTLTDLGSLLGTNSYGYAVNAQRQVAGYYLSNGFARAFLYSSNTITDLGSLGGSNAYALHIDGNGRVVGFAGATNGTRAFLYQNGSTTNLDQALGGTNSYAYGISDSRRFRIRYSSD